MEFAAVPYSHHTHNFGVDVTDFSMFSVKFNRFCTCLHRYRPVNHQKSKRLLMFTPTRRFQYWKFVMFEVAR